MRILLAFLFVYLSSTTHAYFSLPFTSSSRENGDAEKWYVDLSTILSIGTPPQNARIRLGFTAHSGYGDLDLEYSPKCTDGFFNPNASTTFNLEGADNEGAYTFIYGNDTINLVEDVPDTPMLIFWPSKEEETACKGGMMFTLQNNENPSIIRDYLRSKENPILILAFKEVGNNETEPISGSVIFGDYATDLCAKNWKYILTKANKSIWMWHVELDLLFVGKYRSPETGSVRFVFNSYDVVIMEREYNNVLQALGASVDGRVRCDIKTHIKYELNGHSFMVGPDVYVDFESKDKHGNCKHRIQKGNFEFQLPIFFFRSKCVLFNYETNELGIATLKK